MNFFAEIYEVADNAIRPSLRGRSLLYRIWMLPVLVSSFLLGVLIAVTSPLVEHILRLWPFAVVWLIFFY